VWNGFEDALVLTFWTPTPSSECVGSPARAGLLGCDPHPAGPAC
jgi:hypothetical protein